MEEAFNRGKNMSSSSDRGNQQANPKATGGVDPGKCGKTDPTPGASNTGGKPSPAKDKKFSLSFRKSGEDEKSRDDTPKKKYKLKDRIKDIKDGFAEISKNRKEKKAYKFNAGSATLPGGGDRGRRMIYPYTMSAKIAQFPFRYHFDNVWMFKYFIFGCVASLPVFIYLGRKSYAPENVAEWKKKRQELFGIRHH